MRRRLATTLFVLMASAAAAQPAAELQRVRGEIDALSRQLSSLAAQQSAGGDDVAAAKARLAAFNAEEARLSARLGASQARVSRLLGALQMYGKHPPPALLTHPDDAKAAIRAAILIRALTPELQARAQAVAVEVAAARAARREVAAASDGLFLTESEFAERAAEIEALIGQKAALEARLTAEVKASGRDVTALAARAQNLRNNVAPGAPPAAGRLAPPTAAAPTGRFGQAAPRGGTLEGWLWTLRPGAQVRSPAAGLVDYAGPAEGWENVLILNIGGDRHLVLGGVGALQVEQGQRIEAGRLVALMPVAQGAGPAELYLEVRQGGRPIDPARFFAAIGP